MCINNSVYRRRRAGYTTSKKPARRMPYTAEIIYRTACEDYDERLDVLYCDVNYIQAFRDATEKSCCTNLFVQYLDYDAFYACGSNQNGTVCTVFEEDL